MPRSPVPGEQPAPISDGGRDLQPISEDGQPSRPMSGEDSSQQPMSDDEDEPRSPRPVSDASSVFDGVEEPPVRRRSKLSVPVRQGAGIEYGTAEEAMGYMGLIWCRIRDRRERNVAGRTGLLGCDRKRAGNK